MPDGDPAPPVRTLRELRWEFHQTLGASLWGGRLKPRSDPPIPWIVEVEGQELPVYTNADGGNDVSVLLCAGVADRVGIAADIREGQGSTSGGRFEEATSKFVQSGLALFAHLTPRRLYTKPIDKKFDRPLPGTRRRGIPGKKILNYAQFLHLKAIANAVRDNPELKAALSGDYQVAPDILVVYPPFSDAELNEGGAGLDESIASFTHLRGGRGREPILHASVSCKWTMRRDRAQNTRLEALNLVRNRKGRLPHIVAVTMECDPGILGSLSLGTGDIDCVYHGALPELLDSAEEAAHRFGADWKKLYTELRVMADGARLRDIADLPLDLLA